MHFLVGTVVDTMVMTRRYTGPLVSTIVLFVNRSVLNIYWHSNLMNTLSKTSASEFHNCSIITRTSILH